MPGNHDIPLFDVTRRMLDPLGRFRRYVGSELGAVVKDLGARNCFASRGSRVAPGDIVIACYVARWW